MIDKDLEGNQSSFAEMIWQNEPVSSGELVRMCKEKFNWKKSTTYTVLKILCEKGLFQNDGGIVSSVINRDQYYAGKSMRFVDDSFKGSLPAFVAAFASGRKLSSEEIDELQHMIDRFREGE